ncbi:type II toxin-antitoxin system VapC family toxin [Nevskia sp.]|uniref:type II toxin-antitoxin system VapC family toxin n=1 Tax=Nevskia sp. TaxID=1929292 RepID=UPI0025D47430|nr:type II toxin-antitoxin system VapC family toxin [Nevskia sp.]
MNGYLLDTDIASYIIRRRPEALLGKFERHAHEINVSVITAAELRHGYTKSGSKPTEALVEHFLERVVVLDWTADETWTYAAARTAIERAGTPIGAMDLMIASHAISRDLVLVTNNVKHFQKVPLLAIELWV